LKEEKFEEGQYIIKQGESGTKFFIVLEGNLVA
jgi:CRP-like cAMP-binding protein